MEQSVHSSCADARVRIFPFTQRPDGEEVIIANATQSSFLSLPASALDILIWLAEGKTISEAQACYLQKYHENPDIEEFLDLLEQEGFLSRQTADSEEQPSVPSARATKDAHFTWISQNTARLLFSKPVLFSVFILIGASILLLVLTPSLFPAPDILVFKEHAGPLILGLLLFTFFTLFLHELAHLVAARAAGIPTRLGISHRLWILVAEADMTGIWMASRAQRNLAFLAGPLLDGAGAAICLLLLFAQRHGWLVFSAIALVFCQAAFLSYVLRLLWQCYFFLRTDFYGVFVTLFSCKNLMEDTEHFLSNLAARVFPFFRKYDLSAIPSKELKVVRYYSVFWLLGRGAALYTLFFITLPILVGYGIMVPSLFSPSGPLQRLPPGDLIAWIGVFLIIIGPQIAGLFLWLKSLFRKWRYIS